MHNPSNLYLKYPRKALITFLNTKFKSIIIQSRYSWKSEACALSAQTDRAVRHTANAFTPDHSFADDVCCSRRPQLPSSSISDKDGVALCKQPADIPHEPIAGQQLATNLSVTGNADEERSADEKVPWYCPLKVRRKLDHTCQSVFEANRPSEIDMLERKRFCGELEIFLKEHCHKHIQLELFGSSSNGFAFHKSDLDICATFCGHDTDQKVSRYVLTAVADALSLHSDFYKVSTLYKAKVPIVKFCLRNHKFSAGDISLYNKLAVANTNLLSTYAEVDQRFRVLGYMFKHFIKNQSSIGRLRNRTSYAFMLLVIYFLQRCDPPVLPVLQELHHGKRKPKMMVDGWNVWFQDNVDEIRKSWEGYGKNRSTIGELWLQMVRFYAEQFDFETTVVSVRHKKTFTKVMKIRNINHLSQVSNPLWKRKVHGVHWTKKPMLVEDPFDLAHNLTALITRDVHDEFVTLLKDRAKELQDMIDNEGVES